MSGGFSLVGSFVRGFFFFAGPGSMWDLSSPTKVQTNAPVVEGRV